MCPLKYMGTVKQINLEVLPKQCLYNPDGDYNIALFNIVFNTQTLKWQLPYLMQTNYNDSTAVSEMYSPFQESIRND